jgi:arylsulfatase A-like enzyme
VIKRRFPAFDCSVYDRGLRVIREGDLKLIWSSRGDHELYDLARDPAESRNLMAERRDEARGLEEALEEWAAATTAGRAERAPDIDRETLERLSGLGYI